MARTGESYTAARAQLLKRTTLHVTNGDSAAQGIAGIGLPGRVLPWRHVLHDGPLGDFTESYRALDTHDGDFVLWFEADLYDQLQLAQVLSRLHGRRVSLVSIGEHPGIAHFGGLGELTSEQLQRLPAEPLSDEAIALGARAWEALAAPDPRHVAELATVRNGELRFLGEAFDRLAREYPSTRDGLGLTERRLLAGAPGTRVELFLRAAAKETRPFLGDTMAFTILDRLAPLVRDGELTEDGRRVLAGEQDFVAAHGVDRWIGGVHLQGREVPWRFDEAAERLIGPAGRPV
jgi:hypothetical protein